jgi:hypothetical protein
MQNASELSSTPETFEESSTYQRLAAALSDDALFAATHSNFADNSGGNTSPDAGVGGGINSESTSGSGPINLSPELMRRRLSPAERELLTQKSVTPILEQLSFSNERLQNAMQRVGYLECQVEVLQDTIKGIPELRAKATRAIILEIENTSLAAQLAERNDQLIRREKQILSRNQEIELLTKVLDAHKKHLSRVEADLQSLEQKPWVRIFAWLTGTSISKNK